MFTVNGVVISYMEHDSSIYGTRLKAEKTPLIVILDNVRSLNNIGSVFRTCDAFLIEKIYLCGITATPPNKEIHKTTLDATNSIEIGRAHV